MKCVVRLGLLLTSSLSGIAYAGPDMAPLVDPSASATLGIQDTRDTAHAGLLDVNPLLAPPRFADALTTVVVDPDLGTREHPMIPLPSSVWAGLLMVGGIAIYAARQQRALRPV